LSLIGKALDAGQLTDQWFVVEPLGVGQAGAARAQTIEQLGHQQFGTVTVGRAGTGIQARQSAELVPEIKLLGQRFDGGQAAEGGLLLGGDELEAQFGGAFADERHASWTGAAGRCSKSARKTSPAGAEREALPKDPGTKGRKRIELARDSADRKRSDF
jgi:hypothetical protein